MFCEPPQKKSVFFKEIQRVTPKKQATYIRYVIGKLKICPNHHADLLGFLFTEDYLKIKKGLEVVFRLHFSYNFLIKSFLL